MQEASLNKEIEEIGNALPPVCWNKSVYGENVENANLFYIFAGIQIQFG